MNPNPIESGTADWYDGHSSQPKTVRVVLQPGQDGPTLTLHDAASGADNADGTDNAPAIAIYIAKQIGWPEHFNPRRPPARLVVDLGDAGSLEIHDPARWLAAAQAAGQRPSLARRMQTRWPVFVGVLVAAVLVVAAFQRFGAPWLATQLARLVPHEWEQSLADRALQSLTEKTLKPSRLPPMRQDALRARFDALVAHIPPDLQRYPNYTPQYSLTFHRASGSMAVNAFALPGGAVVMTDGLVRVAEREGLPDDALAGVLAHELGHIVHRHHARSIAEQGVFGLTLALATGDLSGVWAAASTIVSGFAYSRAHEREADCFAFALMQRLDIPTEPLGDLFLTFADMAGERGTATEDAEPQARSVAHLLKTHPNTLERAAQFKQPDRRGYCK